MRVEPVVGQQCGNGTQRRDLGETDDPPLGVIGDHDQVNHTFGTAYWLPGEYIRDHYDVDVPLMTTPAGSYTVLMGFWPGGEGKRLKVTRGSNDGSDRVRLGTIEIK